MANRRGAETEKRRFSGSLGHVSVFVISLLKSSYPDTVMVHIPGKRWSRTHNTEHAPFPVNEHKLRAILTVSHLTNILFTISWLSSITRVKSEWLKDPTTLVIRK